MAPGAVPGRTGAASPLGRISVVGHLRHSRGLPCSPMRVLGSYAVVYLLAGHGRFRDASGYSADVGAGDLLTLFPDVGHTYGPDGGDPWSEVYVIFDGPVFDLWRSEGLLDPGRPVRHLEPVDTWSTTFQSVSAAPRRPGAAAGVLGVCQWQNVLAAALLATDGPVADSHDDRWLARATALLDADHRREAPLEQVAGELGLSYDGFRRRFRRLAGTSPARYRSSRAIDLACELMAGGELTDRDIADRLGFCDEFHFSHRFRALTGHSPRQFRASLPRPARSR